MTVTLDADAAELAAEWLRVDPDPTTRAETEQLIAAGGNTLRDRFDHSLLFGTAGLRGKLGAGPARMNRVLVRVVAAALAERLLRDTDRDTGGDGPAPHVVVGYDARHGSADFARDTAQVIVARGLSCTLLPGPLPTPVLSFSVRHLDADAGVMVTASHNPRDDNGYKVYWRGGSLITAPIDEEITDAIAGIPLLTDADLAPLTHPELTMAGDELVDAYVEAILGSVDPEGSRTARIAYTPLHGVGYDTVRLAFAAAGFAPVAVVESQRDPDPDFPTTPFPNPEESGVLDPLLALASATDADVALANDPDADRLAVAVRSGPSWRLLTGNDLGCLLAERLLSRATDDPRTALVINTVVSSRLLSKIAAHHGADYVETLTGFKWIMHEQAQHPDKRFVMGYEEALGYAVNDIVRDKDGVSAALVVAEMAGELRDQGRSLLDLLDDLHRRHGVHRSGQRAVRFEPSPDGPIMDTAMDALRLDPPSELAGEPVRAVRDLARGEGALPPTNGVVLDTDDTRVVFRPSGTEPKLKVYVESVVSAGDDLAAAQQAASARLRTVADAAVAAVCDAERATPPPGPDEQVTHDTALGLFGEVSEGADRADDLRLIVRCIDLTTLEGNDTPARVRSLCAQARRPDPADPTVGPTAAVCVYPLLAPLAAELVGGSAVRVASVAGAFPSGLSSVAVRRADIADAAANGASEIDVVLNRSAFLSGHHDQALAELRDARDAAGDAHLKVIIEVGELVTLERIRAASRLAIEAGADFVKTSTGKSAVSATPPAVLAMIEVVSEHAAATGRRVGIKVAGGVRSATEALGYVAMVRSVLGPDWLTPDLLRFGASSLLGDVLADLTRTEESLR